MRLLRCSNVKSLTRCPATRRHRCHQPTNWFARCNCWNSRCHQMWIQGRASSIENKSSSMSSRWQTNSRQVLAKETWSLISMRRSKRTSTAKKPLQPNNMTCLTRQVMFSGASRKIPDFWPGRMVSKRGTCRSKRTRSLRFRKRSLLATERKRLHSECYSCSSPIARER